MLRHSVMNGALLGSQSELPESLTAVHNMSISVATYSKFVSQFDQRHLGRGWLAHSFSYAN